VSKQFELGRCHRDGCAIDEHQPTVGVDEDGADLPHPLAIRRAGRAPEHRLDPRDQLAWTERLGQVVVGAQLQAKDAVHLVVACGEEDGRCPVAVVAEPAADLEPVHAGQADVEHAGDRPQPAGRGEAGDAVGLGVHAEVVPREIHAYEISDGSFVLHDEHETLARAFGHPLMMADRGHEAVIGDVRILYGSLSLPSAPGSRRPRRRRGRWSARPMREAWARGLNAIAAECTDRFGKPFEELSSEEQDTYLTDLQNGEVSDRFWGDMPVQCFFSELLLKDVLEIYYSHPAAWSEIGFGGPASPRGYVRTGFDERDPWEAEPADV